MASVCLACNNSWLLCVLPNSPQATEKPQQTHGVAQVATAAATEMTVERRSPTSSNVHAASRKVQEM